MNDPQSAEDCLRHCRDVLTDYEHGFAVALIKVYAQSQKIAGMDECRAIYRQALYGPITASEVAKAEEKKP